ncbi:MAG: lysylphosphatidylglycerol synthase transmembrane domain-containing protein [Pseudomonadota bacterium]|nr:lysylphosphatidylglycerol synthase transmembrane domain-containing protein [Pseudomonadota bacterium]
MLKLLFSISIIYILIHFNIINVNDIALLTKNYTLVLYSLIIFFIVIILASLKWWILLVSANYNIPFLMAYFLYSTGLFFNNFMPGGTGGDIIKGVYLYKFVAKSQRTGALFTIIIDRIIGLHALTIIALSSYFLLINNITFELNFAFISIIFIAIFSMPIMFYSVMCIGKLLSYIITKNFKSSIILKLEDIFSRLLEAFKNYKNKKLYLFSCWILSIINHLLTLFCFYIVTIILEINMLDIFEVIYVGSFSLMANFIPLTPGGIGIGESAFNFFAESLQGNNLKNIAYGSIFFLGFRVLFTFVTLTGVISYILLDKPSFKYNNKDI